MGNWLRAFLLCLVIPAFRAYDRFLHPEIWAEDCFLIERVLKNENWGEFLVPMAGYFHLIQKLIIKASVLLFPLSYLPLFNMICYAVFTGFSFSWFARSSYRWLVPKDSHRILICLCFTLTPGLNEMFGNLPNLNWILYFWLMIILLKPLDEAFSWTERIISPLIIFSIGTSIGLFFLSLWRTLASLKKKGVKDSLVVLVVILLAQVALYFVRETHEVNTFYLRNIWLTPYFKHVFLGLFAQPLLGDYVATWMTSIRGMAFVIPFLFIIASIPFFNRMEKTRKMALVTAIVGTSTTMVLCWMARRGLGDYYNVTPDNGFWIGHYAFPFGVSSILLWGLLTSSHSRLLFYLFVSLTFLHAMPRFWINRYGTEPRWKKAVDIWESTGRPEVVGPIYPDQWNIVLPNKQKKASRP